MSSPKTIFCDIDGVIFHHRLLSEVSTKDTKILNGVMEKFEEWNRKDYYIVLTTGRPPSMRKYTERQILESGLFFDELIMGLPRGDRVVINDYKPNSDEETAVGISVVRNEGLVDVQI